MIRPSTLLLPLLLLPACTASPPPEPFTPRFDQIAIEGRALLASDDFLKSIDPPGSPTKFQIVHLNNDQLTLWIRTTQADAHTITFDFPRLTLILGSSGTMTLHELQGFVGNPPASNRDLPPKLNMLDLGLTLDLAAAETPEHQFRVTLKQVHVTNPNVRDDWRFVIPPGLPLQVVTSDKGVFALRGIRNESSVRPHRDLILLIRCQGIVQKEIESELFGPGYDRPTGLPNSRPASTPTPH